MILKNGNFGQFFGLIFSIRLIRGLTLTRVYTVVEIKFTLFDDMNELKHLNFKLNFCWLKVSMTLISFAFLSEFEKNLIKIRDKNWFSV
jgi:hypothetical protein